MSGILIGGRAISSAADAAPGGPESPGLYGKLSSKGDFLTRRLPRSFVDPLDAWIQAGMVTSRQCLGDDWHSAYLTAPIWRYVLSPGVCGGDAVCGIMMPSVDRVGRHFPLALASIFPDCGNPWAVLACNADWFRHLEDLALTSLDDSFDFAVFESALENAGPPSPGARPRSARSAEAPLQSQKAWRFNIAPDDKMGLLDPELPHQFLTAAIPNYGLWWCEGSDRVRPSLLVSEGLPSPDGFTALLDGRWEHWGWSAPIPEGSQQAGKGASPLGDFDPELGI